MKKGKRKPGVRDYYMEDLGFEDVSNLEKMDEEPTPELMFKHQWWGKYNERHRKEVK